MDTRSLDVRLGVPFKQLLGALETLFDMPTLRITAIMRAGLEASDAGSMGSVFETWEQASGFLLFFSRFLAAHGPICSLAR